MKEGRVHAMSNAKYLYKNLQKIKLGGGESEHFVISLPFADSLFKWRQRICFLEINWELSKGAKWRKN